MIHVLILDILGVFYRHIMIQDLLRLCYMLNGTNPEILSTRQHSRNHYLSVDYYLEGRFLTDHLYFIRNVKQDAYLLNSLEMLYSVI